MIKGLSQTSREHGFTFNEVLVAMSLVVVAILGYSLTTLSVIRGSAATDNYTAAVNLAHDKIEELKALSRLSDEDRCPSGGERGVTVSGVVGGAFDRCWRVSNSPLGSHLKQIDVTVSWRDYESHEVTLSTLLYTG